MASMLSLLDVLPRHERVDIGGAQIDVFGISGGDWGEILRRYPDAFQQIANAGSQPIKMEIGLMGALLAASQHNAENTQSLLGNEHAEARARMLGARDQMKVMQAMGRCTFPDGVGPFLEDLVSMSESTLAATELVVQVSSRGQDTPSPPPRKNSGQHDTQTSGDSPPAK